MQLHHTPPHPQASKIATFQGDMDLLTLSNAALAAQVVGLELQAAALQRQLADALTAQQQAQLELKDVRERATRDAKSADAAAGEAARAVADAEGRLRLLGDALKEREGELELAGCK